MQLTNTICVIILAATTAATALPEPGCGARGQGCWKMKRAANALAEALAEPAADVIDARCDLAGGVCQKARMLTRDLADVVAAVQDDPEAYYNSLNFEDDATTETAAKERVKREAEADARCGARGQGCWKEKRDAAPAPGCGARGQGCWKEKRVAIPEAEAEANPEARCGARGQGCWKIKREAVSEADAGCGARGQGCWKVKRAAEAIADALAEPLPGCGARGQGCWKEKRDINALRNAARDVLDKL